MNNQDQATDYGAELLHDLLDEQIVPFHIMPNWAEDTLDVYQYRVFGAIRRMVKPEEPVAWPSVSTLARRTGISERKVQMVIKQLVEMGALKVSRRKNQSGGDTSSVYVVSWAPPRTSCTPPGAYGAPPRVHEVHPNNNHSEQDPFEQDCSEPEKQDLKLEPVEAEIIEAINEVPRFKRTYLQDKEKAHRVLKRVLTKAATFGIPPSEVLSIARRCANYHSSTKAFSHGMLVLEDWIEREGKRKPEASPVGRDKPTLTQIFGRQG